jgi:hypothetical protein
MVIIANNSKLINVLISKCLIKSLFFEYEFLYSLSWLLVDVLLKSDQQSKYNSIGLTYLRHSNWSLGYFSG